MLINAGVIGIVYSDGYSDTLAQELLAEADIDLMQK
jgi:deoxycytidylate deaminase